MRLRTLKNGTIFAAAAAAAAYSAFAGKGFFNKPRFRDQHEALGKYVESNYPDCTYSPITMHGRGWSSCVRRQGRVVSNIYFSRGSDGVYIFTESKV